MDAYARSQSSVKAQRSGSMPTNMLLETLHAVCAPGWEKLAMRESSCATAMQH